MSLYTWLNDSIAMAELMSGAGAAILGATLVEVAQYQADSRFRIRIEWLAPAVRLPARISNDTVVVFAALWRRITRGEVPTSGFVEMAAAGGEDPDAVSHRALQVLGRSLSPNTIVVDVDPGRETMLAHHLVMPGPGSPNP